MMKEMHQMAKKLAGAEDRYRESEALHRRSSNEWHTRIQALEKDMDALRAQHNATIGELESFRQRNSELAEKTRQLLEARTMELSGAQRFLTQTDSLSGAEAIALAESLNAEILQAAAYIADSLQCSHRQLQVNAETMWREDSYRRGSRLLGEAMLLALRSSRRQNDSNLDPTLVQIALQISLVHCCTNVVASWVCGARWSENEIRCITSSHRRRTSSFWKMAIDDSCQGQIVGQRRLHHVLRRQCTSPGPDWRFVFAKVLVRTSLRHTSTP